jgi:hypothetical protein
VLEPPRRAFLAIADISGYTGYLAGVELDHATDILADLIGTVVESMAPFRLSKLEGDAAFAHLEGDSIDPSTLQDCIEGTYVAFRTRLRDITQASCCECNACILIPRLDLKFVVHHGLVARQRFVGLEELVGADVILVHRLLKNDVLAGTGVGAYALYTQAAVDAAGMDPTGQGMLEHHETVDVAGDVTTWIRDLDMVWQAHLEGPRAAIPPEDVVGTWTLELPVPVPIAWEYITLPARRPLWQTEVSEVIESSPDGRRGVGTTNHCMHGKDAVIERILVWQPPNSWLVHSKLPESMGGIDMLLSDELVELPDGSTSVTLVAARAGEMSPDQFAGLRAALQGWMTSLLANLTALMSEVAERMSLDAPAAPVVAASEARYLTSPVLGGIQGEARSPA